MPVVKNRKKVTRSQWADIYQQLREERRKQKFTAPRGFWILRSYAKKLFSNSIVPRDLDSILPITRTPNPNRGIDDVMKYNLCDVAALVLRLQPTYGPDDRAPARGRTIVTTSAKKEFQLETCQLMRLVPRDVKPNPHHPNLKMPIYNRADVEDLKARIEAAAANPTGVPIDEEDDDEDEVEDYFDGMTLGEAAIKFEALTDIHLEPRVINNMY